MNIKSLIITLAVGASLCTGASAQVCEKYDGFQLNKMSQDGRYIADAVDKVKIVDRKTGKVYSYGSNYSLGRTYAFSDEGTAVGSISNTQPAYWKDGEWHELPYTFERVTLTRAEAITADGSIIVGDIDARSETKKAWPMTQPVVWERQEDGTYGLPTLLPIPDKDVTGCSPQQVMTQGISADGSVILAQMVDYMGRLQYQVVYHRTPAGDWTMETSGLNEMVKPGSTWPPLPQQPVTPKVDNYITADEIAEYNAAYDRYLDSLEIKGLTGINPHRPLPEEFIKEKREQWDADKAKYEMDSYNYVIGLEAFTNAYMQNLTGGVFGFNSGKMSYNGKYYVGNYHHADPTWTGPISQAGTWTAPMFYSTDDPSKGHLTEHQTLGSFTVLNNGKLICASPLNDANVWCRTPYFVDPATDEITPMEEWIKTESPTAYQWLKDNMSFDMTADQNDGVAATGVLELGTIRTDKDMRRMIAYAVDPSRRSFVSYFIDLDADPTGLATIDSAESLTATYSRMSATLSIHGEATKAELIDLNGRTLLSLTAPGNSVDLSAFVGRGIAIIKLTGINGTATTLKLSL